MYFNEGMDCSIEDRIRTLTLGSENVSVPPQAYAGNSDCYYNVPSTNLTNPESVQKVQCERLKYVLNQFEKERSDTTFFRNCLFCRKHFTVNRCCLLNHLMEQHNFFIGAPDNIVFINELLDVLENMLKKLQCFYCENIFKDWLTLKEHMRKRQHKRINPDNKSFDRFYLINYLEPGKTWVDVQKEKDGFSRDSDEKEMEMAVQQDESSEYVCLYCDCRIYDFEELLEHMKDDHKFDFKDLKKRHSLKFYSQIKLINYIRRRVFEKQCAVCDLIFNFRDELIKHMVDTDHIKILPDPAKWDQPMFYFSTFENDNVLCALDTDDESDFEEDQMVYPEEPAPCFWGTEREVPVSNSLAYLKSAEQNVS